MKFFVCFCFLRAVLSSHKLTASVDFCVKKHHHAFKNTNTEHMKTAQQYQDPTALTLYKLKMDFLSSKPFCLSTAVYNGSKETSSLQSGPDD